MRYELTKELETGNEMIDIEHKELLHAVNNIVDACNTGKERDIVEPAITFLLTYVDMHFAHEEQLQSDNHYPNMESHKAFHDSYKKQLKEIATQVPLDNPTIKDVEKLNEHIAVLINHIHTEDKKLGTYLKQL